MQKKVELFNLQAYLFIWWRAKKKTKSKNKEVLQFNVNGKANSKSSARFYHSAPETISCVITSSTPKRERLRFSTLILCTFNVYSKNFLNVNRSVFFFCVLDIKERNVENI